MGGATGGCGGIWDQGAVQWKWSLVLQQTVFIQHCTSDWISTPLTLVDTCQVNDIWKDGLGRVSMVHPHWTAALFKSTCQHAHAAVNWLSMSLSHSEKQQVHRHTVAAVLKHWIDNYREKQRLQQSYFLAAVELVIVAVPAMRMMTIYPNLQMQYTLSRYRKKNSRPTILAVKSVLFCT